MLSIPLFSSGYKSRSSSVTSVTMTGLFVADAEDRGDPMVAYPTPGLTQFGTPPAVERGRHVSSAFPDRLYVVAGGSLYQVGNDGVAISRGNINTASGNVSLADNGAQLMLVDGQGGWILNMNTNVFLPITDSEFPDSARSVTFQDGYFIVEVPGTGRFQLSSLYDGFLWNGLDTETASSSPDVTEAVLSYGGYLQVYGTRSVERFSNTGALSFPFTRIQGGNLEYGVVSRDTIVPMDESVIFLARNRLGEACLVQSGLSGGANIVSTPDINYLWNNYSTLIDAEAFAYRLDGRSFYEITFPSANKTWLYNSTMGSWSEVSGLSGRHDVRDGVAFGERFIVFSSSEPKMYILDKNAYDDNGMSIKRQITSRHIFSPNYNRLGAYRVRLDVQTGALLPTGQGADPNVALEISRDGGHTWGNKIWRSLGKLGEFGRLVQWNRCGMGRDVTFRFTVTDPFNFIAMGAYMDVQELSS